MSKSIHSPDHLRLRELLIAARKEAGLTQQEVGHRLKRPQSYVAKYEGGERRLDVIEFIAVVRALDRDPIDVFGQLVASSTTAASPRRLSRSE